MPPVVRSVAAPAAARSPARTAEERARANSTGRRRARGPPPTGSVPPGVCTTKAWLRPLRCLRRRAARPEHVVVEPRLLGRISDAVDHGHRLLQLLVGEM